MTLDLHSYQQRLIGWALLPLALALLAAAAAFMYMFHSQQVAAAQRRVDTMAAEIDANLSRHIQGLRTLGAESVAPSANRTLAQLYANAVAYERAAGFPVLLTDETRHIWLSSARPLGEVLPSVPTPAGPSALETALRSGQAQVGNVVPGPIAGRPVVPIIMPVPELPGRKAWITSLPTDLWQRRMDQAEIPAGWNVVLLDGNGQVIAGHGADFKTAMSPSASGWRFTATGQQAPWTSVIHASHWTLFKLQFRLGVALLLVLALVGTSAAWLAKRSSHKLHAAIAQLSDSGAAPASPDGPTPRIVEIDAVHRELQRLRATGHAIERRERERIARDLHDGVQQHLAAMQMSVEHAQARVVRSDAEAAALLQESINHSRQVIDELGHTINNLRPAAITDLGLVAAIEHMAQRLMRLTDLQIEVETIDDQDMLKNLPEAVSDCVFRVVQECLNNVRKHAQASFVHVVLDTTDGWDLQLQVTDDGIGIASDAVPKVNSFGLISMRQRVMALGGTLEVQPGRLDGVASGTSVQVRVPLRPAGGHIGL